MKEINIDQIIADDNIRNSYEDIEQLSESIKSNGLLSPVTVSKIAENKYKLIVGHRRFLACQSLGWIIIPAIIREIDNLKIIQLTENIQRSDLTRLESSKTVYDLLTELNLSNRKLSKLINKSDIWIGERKAFYIIYTFLESHSIDSLELLTFRIASSLVKYPEENWLFLAPKLLGNKYHATYVVKKDIERFLTKGIIKVKTKKLDKVPIKLSEMHVILRKFPISELSHLRYSMTFTSERHRNEVLHILKRMGGEII